MGKVFVIVDDDIEKKFREKFIRKRGDISKKIEEMMKKEILKNEKTNSNKSTGN